MLTKLEVNGFKNLLDFEADFGPYTCIAGLNGVGKSNIFDAIQFLAFLSELTIVEAAMKVRDSGGAGEPSDIFYTDGVNRSESMTIAVEMIVDPVVVDDFGIEASVTSTYLRYEIEIGWHAGGERKQSRLYIKREELGYKRKGDAVDSLKFPMSVKDFRDGAVFNKRKGAGYISTSNAGDVTVINVHQDGGSSGQPQKIPAERAMRTVIANTNSSVTPTILAARKEMQSWRFLALEPSAMRRSSNFHDPRTITQNGDYLASTLYKLMEDDPSIISIVSARLAEMIPVKGIRVDVDDARQTLTLEIKERSGAFIPTRALSDGTLRFLTLCIMAVDYDFRGLLCFEEPENGIHPAKIKSILDLIKDLTVDVNEAPSDENPMRQVIVATHSPVLVQLQKPDDLLYVDVVKILGPFGSPATTVRCFTLQNTWRSVMGYKVIGMGSIISYLLHPVGTQLSLDNI